MSQYLEFFLKVDNKFILLNSFSRNSYMYRLFGAPYGKARPIYEDDFTTAIETVNNRIDGLDEQIAQRQIELTLMWNGEAASMRSMTSALSFRMRSPSSQLRRETTLMCGRRLTRTCLSGDMRASIRPAQIPMGRKHLSILGLNVIFLNLKNSEALKI